VGFPLPSFLHPWSRSVIRGRPADLWQKIRMKDCFQCLALVR
jgi:hypothetical protein